MALSTGLLTIFGRPVLGLVVSEIVKGQANTSNASNEVVGSLTSEALRSIAWYWIDLGIVAAGMVISLVGFIQLASIRSEPHWAWGAVVLALGACILSIRMRHSGEQGIYDYRWPKQVKFWSHSKDFYKGVPWVHWVARLALAFLSLLFMYLMGNDGSLPMAILPLE